MDGVGRSPSQPADVTLQDLYSARRGEAPFGREPLTLNGAQDHIAVIYSQFTRSNSGRITGATTVPMSHATVINHYYNSQQQEPLPNRRARRYTLVYSVLRFHYAYQLHRIIFNIFSRGGAYLVASSFDPAEFVVLVHDYQLECAELTSSEIRHLIEFLGARDLNERHGPPSGQAPSPSRNLSIAEMLHPLRFIYSDTQEPELARRLGELLPHVELVRARNCSYLEAFERPRR
ncbi:hypothetical protein IWW47_005004 [Coemansia sp. RSA 2052]|nr:hypothetical protein IWW47_005004 [Coemansia sp. RSA 2052]